MKPDEKKKMKAFIGGRIRSRREELGLSQGDVARELGINQTKVSDIENGIRRIDLVVELPVLCQILKKPVSWFIPGEYDIEMEDPQNPILPLLRALYPSNIFSSKDLDRIYSFLELSLEGYISTDPELRKRSHDADIEVHNREHQKQKEEQAKRRK